MYVLNLFWQLIKKIISHKRHCYVESKTHHCEAIGGESNTMMPYMRPGFTYFIVKNQSIPVKV